MVEELATRGGAKYTVVLDFDLDLRSPDTLVWALNTRTGRKRDFTFVPARGGGLDPSGSPPGSGHGLLASEGGAEPDFTRVIIDATRKWGYPPVALPRKSFMDRAIQIWESHTDLPQPQMRSPWYGYELGYWPEPLQHYADMITAGDYVELGEEMVEFHQPITEEMVQRNVD